MGAGRQLAWDFGHEEITQETVDALVAEMQEVYLRDERPWVIGFSGGKDSTAVVQLAYRVLEPDRTDNRNGRLRPRYVDHWRPVHGWKEEQVWDIIQRYRVNPAPAYHLGWGRLSCMTCIFGSANQWASVAQIDPNRFDHIARYEQAFGYTIHRSESVRDRAEKGAPYPMDPEMVRIAMSETYDQPIILPDGVEWILPAGAFGEKDGPC